MMSLLVLLALYLVPLGLLTWLYSIEPAYAGIAVVVIGGALGIGMAGF